MQVFGQHTRTQEEGGAETNWQHSSRYPKLHEHTQGPRCCLYSNEGSIVHIEILHCVLGTNV